MTRLAIINKRPALQLTIDALREAIVESQLQPGERLREADLSDQFGVSRGTVRSALQQLTSDGLVIQQPYTGWSVMTFSAVDLWELSTLRAGLEGLAAELASEQRKAAALAHLQAAGRALAEACARRDRDAAVRCDFDLHSAIVAAAGHRRLAAQYSLIEHQVRFFVNSTYRPDENYDHVSARHEAIVEAIVRGDAELARRLVVEHAKSEGRRMAATVAAGQQPDPSNQVR